MIKVTRWRARAMLAAGFVVAMTAGGVISVAPAIADAGPGGSCERELPVGASTLDVTFAGEVYGVLVQVPDAPLRRELPLVVDLHGSNANGGVQADISDLGEVGAANGFIVVNPTGDLEFPQTLPDGNWAWNVPGVPLTSGTYPPEGARDDVAFLRAVVDAVDAAGCVDERRVFATGFSGGGRMASALACEASDVFAVAASCTPERPVAVVSFHGTADFVNPYPGNSDPRWGYSVQLAAERWAALNECRTGPVVVSVGAGITAYSWSKCSKQADVVVYEVAEGGHTWPGTDVDLSALGATTQEINASQTMWEFFKAHPRRG